MREKYKKITLAPFCYSRFSINEMIRIMIICIIPQLIMLIVTKSYASVHLLFLMIFISISTELLHSLIMKTGIKISWSTILQGALIGLLLPSTYSPFIAGIVAFVVLFFEKAIFTNFAQFWQNPIIITVILFFFIAPELYPGFMILPENIQFTNIGTRLFTDNILAISPVDIKITTMLNQYLHTFGIQIPEGYITLFFDSQSTIPAFRFNAVTLLTSTVLFITKTVDYLIPTLFIALYAFFVYAFSLYPYAGILGMGDVLLALLTSGTLFCAFFLITWFGTTPKTILGKLFFAIIAASIAFLICGAGTSTMGMFFVLLLLNFLSPIILHIESIIYERQLKKQLTQTELTQR